MDNSANQKAINLALAGKWEEAVKANLEILADTPDDVDALNRLGRAYTELGKFEEARRASEKVLKIDPFNSIALKSQERLKSAKEGSAPISNPGVVSSPEAFLEESGKTKLVTLLNLGENDILTSLDPGEEVKFICYPHKISVATLDGRYIGRLPDDIAARLRNLIKAGNKYQVLIKSIATKNVTVFVREISGNPQTADTPSFPPERINYVSFTPPELVHKDIPNVETTEESSD